VHHCFEFEVLTSMDIFATLTPWSRTIERLALFTELVQPVPLCKKKNKKKRTRCRHPRTCAVHTHVEHKHAHALWTKVNQHFFTCSKFNNVQNIRTKSSLNEHTLTTKTSVSSNRI
jgi:hypothetical protein